MWSAALQLFLALSMSYQSLRYFRCDRTGTVATVLVALLLRLRRARRSTTPLLSDGSSWSSVGKKITLNRRWPPSAQRRHGVSLCVSPRCALPQQKKKKTLAHSTIIALTAGGHGIVTHGSHGVAYAFSRGKGGSSVALCCISAHAPLQGSTSRQHFIYNLHRQWDRGGLPSAIVMFCYLADLHALRC